MEIHIPIIPVLEPCHILLHAALRFLSSVLKIVQRFFWSLSFAANFGGPGFVCVFLVTEKSRKQGTDTTG